MKRFLFLFISFLFVGCGYFVEEEPEEVEIKSVVDNVKSNLIRFNTDNVSSIGRGISRNIEILDELIIKIKESSSYEEVFPEIVSGVTALANSYREIANMKEDISGTLNKRINRIQTQKERVNKKINHIRDKINESNFELKNEKVDYRKTALKTKIKFQKQELEVWDKFANGIQFNDLIKRLTEASGGINRFVDILESNADVYEQASITLKAIQSYKNAHKDLQEVLAVVDLGDDLIETWDKLAIIIDDAMEKIEVVESFEF